MPMRCAPGLAAAGCRAALLAAALLLAASAGRAEQLSELGGEPILPIPLSLDVDPERAQLGRRLYHDRMLSSGGSVSCASCHDLEQGGTDGLTVSRTASGAQGVVNTPTLFNSALNYRFGWRGQLRSLEAQIEVVLHEPEGMNTTWAELLAKLRANDSYVAAFKRLYPEGVSKAAVLDAFAAYQRALITPNARFDQFLRGRQNALTPQERRGYVLFKSLGCVTCHQGVNVGGNLFQKVGIFEDYFAKRGDITEADLGRMLDTGAERDRYVFRVPSLRNVALTPPYFHDGSQRTLAEAIRRMGEIQLGITLGDGEVNLIAGFLDTLTGELDGRLTEAD